MKKAKHIVYVLALAIAALLPGIAGAAEKKAAKEAAPESRWSWDFKFGVDRESSKVKNEIYKPSLTGTYKKSKKAASSFKFGFADTSYSRSKAKSKYALDGEWKRKTAGGSFRFKTAISRFPNNKAMNAVDFTLEGTRKFNKQHSTTLGFTYTPSTYAGKSVTKTTVGGDDDEEEEADDEDTSAEEECREEFETGIAVNDAGVPLTVGAITDMTWWEYYYETAFAANGGDDDAATITADAQEDTFCAQANPVPAGTTKSLTQVADIKAKKLSINLKHEFAPADGLKFSFEVKTKGTALKGNPSLKDRTKDVDTVGFTLGTDWDVNKVHSISFDIGTETGKSSVKNLGVSPDTSYRKQSYKFSFSSKLTKEVKTTFDLGLDNKKYTTTNAIAGDSYNGRKDKSVKYGFKVSYKASKNVDWTLGWKKSNTDLKKVANTTKSRSNTISLGFSYSF